MGVCYDECSNHGKLLLIFRIIYKNNKNIGDCVSMGCTCDVGWFNDNCNTSLLAHYLKVNLNSYIYHLKIGFFFLAIYIYGPIFFVGSLYLLCFSKCHQRSL